MFLDSIIIENFKCFRHFELSLNDRLSILVGDNETGKSTLLEAINVCLTGQLNGRPALYELSPYLFNKAAVAEYLANLRQRKAVSAPKILIEAYLKDIDEFARLKGTNNSRRENVPGIAISIEFDEDYKAEYEKYISEPNELVTVPVEYYALSWYSFAYDTITKRSLKLKVILIDAAAIRLQYGTDYYISKLIDDSLDAKERAELSVAYRKLKEQFKSSEAIKKINENLMLQKGKISDKDLSVSIDVTQRTSWQSNLTSYLDDIPFQFIGKGDQNILKMLLALEQKVADSQIILIEEPENHLSYSRMNYLINKIRDKCSQKQVILSTHSTFVMNKLGIDSVIMLGHNQTKSTLNALSKDTQDYFLKLPGYDTLRLIIARKAILVEGPSDELFVQKAYLQIHNKLPIEDQVDVISVRGLSFKRFLDIAILLDTNVFVLVDNDGDYDRKVIKKFEDYNGKGNIKVHFCKNNDLKTLENNIVEVNTLDNLNDILHKKFNCKDDLLGYMIDNKTECALKIFQTDKDILIPEYIQEALK